MKKFSIKFDILFIVFFIVVLSFFTVSRIRKNYDLSPLTSTNRNLILIRTSIDEFYELYNRYPTEEEIRGFDDERLFTLILNHNLDRSFRLLKNIEFPVTPKYTKKVDGITVEIEESNNIKICTKLDNLGLDNSIFSSNGGWIYSPLNGEFRANLQTSEGKDKLKDLSRPNWGKKVDWYYK